MRLESVVPDRKNNQHVVEVAVTNVYYAPGLSVTLLSVSQLVNAVYVVRFGGNRWEVLRGKTKRLVLHAREHNGVYVVRTNFSSLVDTALVTAFTARHRDSLAQWHRRLGHLHITACRRLASGTAVTGVNIEEGPDPPACRSCAIAKVSRAPAPRERSSNDAVADTVCHIDLSGPLQRSYHGHEFFMVAVWRGYVRVYGLRHKNEAADHTAAFLQFISRQASVPVADIRTLRTDGGTEFLTADFRRLVATEGFRHQHATPYRSQQNGVAERMIRTITEMAAAMMVESKLPHYLWEDALRHAAYIRNRVPRRRATTTPHELLFASKPDLGNIPMFGQSLVVRTPEPIRRKQFRFYGRGSVGAFIGFSEEIRGYRVYLPGHIGRRIKETTDAVLLDSLLHEEIVLDDAPTTASQAGEGESSQGLREGEDSGDVRSTTDLLQDTSLSRDEVEEYNGASELTRARRSERISARDIDPAFLCLAEVIREPFNVAEARRSPQWPEWRRAIRLELDALKANDTFTLVDPPEGANILDNTIQFRLKTGPDGAIVQYKARICARGDRQVYMLDYVETHAPVVDLICVRIFLVMAAKHKMKTRQGDVPAAYLKADVKQTIYVRQVKAFEEAGDPHKVWRLRKALYGLKQAGREWNREIDTFLRNYGLRPTAGDACLYYKWVDNGLLLVCLYVDDILVGHCRERHVDDLMAALSTQYQVKNLGEPTQFLGMCIERPNKNEIRLSQRAYVDEVLYRFAMDPVRPTSTPMVPRTRLDTLNTAPTADEVNKMAKMPFRQVVGSLLYLARVTRPDIAFAVNQIARHCAKPRKAAWDAAKYLLRYLAGTRDSKLQLRPKGDGLQLATDADWANDLEDRKSVSGYTVFLFGAPIAWGSVKQGVVAQSSTAAEFIAANDGLLQAEWILLVLNELLAETKETIGLTMLVDNQPTIHRIKKDGSSGAQKAVDIRFHALKDAWRTGTMTLEYVPTSSNPADLLTKALGRVELQRKRCLNGLL